MPASGQAIEAKRQPPEAVLSHLPAEGDAIVDLGNGELKTVVDAIKAGAAQRGAGAVPDQVLALLAGHSNLGVHTELLSEGFVDLVETGVITGTRKRTHRNKIITTTALGTKRLFDFVADNPGVEFWPVEETNNPRKIAEEPHFTSINATIEVDFLGQCASESLGSAYWSSSGGQHDRRAHPAPDRHRPPQVPRRADRGGPRLRLPQPGLRRIITSST